ncbi:MAG: hypothetical protein HYT80_00940 [Euryarchaeota archaeon]|nr:hypothetical protein [Euryarchaeota archaeon]
MLRHGAATPDLALRVGRTTIAAGEETRVPLEVQNLAAHQRILNITGSLVAGADPAWQFSVVPRVLVAGHDSTNVTVRVRAPALRDAPLLVATVRFRADIAGEPHVFGLRYADFAAVAPLDEAHRTLYLHARGGHGLPQPIPGAHVLQFGYGDLNRGENDPTAKDTDVVTLIHQGTVTQPGFRFARMVSAHRWAPNPARWDPQEPLRGQIGIEVAAPIEATLRFTISAGDAVPAAKWEKTVSLARGPQVVPFETPWRAPRDDLEVKDEQLSFEFWMERAGADSAVYGYAFFVAQPALLPKVTRVELPITRPPAPVEDPDLPRVVVEAAEDRDAFTNPGKRHVFEVDLRNEASRAVEVDLAVVSVEGKWPVEVRPGRALKLPAHDSARIGLAVEAPPSAREGETFRFELVVNDTSSGRTLDRAAFRVTATGGVSVENDTFEERTEDVRKVRAQETAGSPGPGSALAVAAVAVVIVGRRLARRG